MKLNKSNLFTLIWLTHLFTYYTIYNIILRISRNDYTKFYDVIFGFAIGLYGLFEQLPLFFIIPIVLMLILIKTRWRKKWFIAYVLSICFAYLTNYLWIFSNNKHDIILYSPDSINLIYVILSSIGISILLNWLIFKKQYKKLGL